MLDIRTQKWQDKRTGEWRSKVTIKRRPGTSYVLVNPTTGEICELAHSLPVTKEGQYSLF